MQIHRWRKAGLSERKPGKKARHRITTAGVQAIRLGRHVPGDISRTVGPTITTKTLLCPQPGCFNEFPCESHPFLLNPHPIEDC